MAKKVFQPSLCHISSAGAGTLSAVETPLELKKFS